MAVYHVLSLFTMCYPSSHIDGRGKRPWCKGTKSWGNPWTPSMIMGGVGDTMLHPTTSTRVEVKHDEEVWIQVICQPVLRTETGKPMEVCAINDWIVFLLWKMNECFFFN